MKIKNFVVFQLGFFLTLCFFLLLFNKSSFAADFAADYQVEYFLRQSGSTISSDVNFNIEITNLRSDVFVKKFSLLFPKYFTIEDIKARDDKGELMPLVNVDDEMTKIELEFSDPATGKNSVNNFYLSFSQDNLFTVNGNVWEVILPTIANRQEGGYRVIVNLPQSTDKKISVAKPKADEIIGKKLIWHNPRTETIYAVFGDRQIYNTNLVYTLQNLKLMPVYTDIAFPPDTAYQQIYVNQVNPRPGKVFIDSDGNYIGRYILKPKEKKTIVFNADIVVSTTPRDVFKKLTPLQIKNQESYLLNPKEYWQLDNPDRFNNLKSVSDIYYYLVGNLRYDYKKISSSEKRMGAQKAVENPERAVCTEFTDLFVAIAREKGIFSREIEGYGFSSDRKLRPMSFVSDILHAWPEYYDLRSRTWIPLDPTWENTSGIDYFSSFDLNHIAFAIHARDDRYPYPAGTYKIENSKDILIKAVAEEPKENVSQRLAVEQLPAVIYAEKQYRLKIKLANESNVFLYDKIIAFAGDGLTFSPPRIIVDQIAPGETREYPVVLSAGKIFSKKKAVIAADDQNGRLFSGSVIILPKYYNLLSLFSLVSAILLAGVTLIYVKRRSR